MKQLIKYRSKRFLLLNNHLEKYRQHASIEGLHRIRIELKKIKTLFDITEHSSKDFNSSKANKSLKIIFRDAGCIREADVLHKLFRVYELKEIEKDIGAGINKRKSAIALFQHNTKRYQSMVNRARSETKKYSHEVTRKNLKKYISRLKHKINKKISRGYRINELHEIRKQIKRVLYLWQILQPKNTYRKLTLYNKLQIEIGKWHDKKTLIKFLKENRNNFFAPVIRKLKSECAQDIQLITPLLSKIKN